MPNAVNADLANVGRFFADHQGQLIIGSGAVIALLLIWLGWRFYRSRSRSRWVGGLAAVVVLAWTAEGIWQFARDRIHLPVTFAALTFFVFEAMMLAAGMRADEHRSAKGVPGPAGRYVWVLAACSGGISALGAQTPAEVPFRIVLPLLAVGLWWVGLTAERDSDTDDMRAERARLAAEREATWVHTPTSLMVRAGLKKPGATSTTEAQREHDIRRMVLTADTIAAGGRRADRARKRLRRMARTADTGMIAEVAERVRQAVDAERLMVPGTVQAPPAAHNGHRANGHTPALSIASATLPAGHHRSVADETADYAADVVADDRPADGDRSPAEDARRDLARDAYRESVATGRPLSGAELARKFGQSNPRWGTRRIAEVRAEQEVNQ